jgi:hypothetical protein
MINAAENELIVSNDNETAINRSSWSQDSDLVMGLVSAAVIFIVLLASLPVILYIRFV